MTREGAKQRIATLLQANNIYPELEEAVHIAIEALMQEPCEDAISRAEAIKAMESLEKSDIEAYGCPIPEGFDGKRAIESLKKLPPVTLKQETVTEFADRCRECGAKYGKLLKQKSGEWIPVSERPPENKTYVLTTIAELKPTGTYEEMASFQFGVIATMLADISKSLAIIADKEQRSDKE